MKKRFVLYFGYSIVVYAGEYRDFYKNIDTPSNQNTERDFLKKQDDQRTALKRDQLDAQKALEDQINNTKNKEVKKSLENKFAALKKQHTIDLNNLIDQQNQAHIIYREKKYQNNQAQSQHETTIQKDLSNQFNAYTQEGLGKAITIRKKYRTLRQDLEEAKQNDPEYKKLQQLQQHLDGNILLEKRKIEKLINSEEKYLESGTLGTDIKQRKTLESLKASHEKQLQDLNNKIAQQKTIIQSLSEKIDQKYKNQLDDLYTKEQADLQTVSYNPSDKRYDPTKPTLDEERAEQESMTPEQRAQKRELERQKREEEIAQQKELLKQKNMLTIKSSIQDILSLISKSRIIDNPESILTPDQKTILKKAFKDLKPQDILDAINANPEIATLYHHKKNVLMDILNELLPKNLQIKRNLDVLQDVTSDPFIFKTSSLNIEKTLSITTPQEIDTLSQAVSKDLAYTQKESNALDTFLTSMQQALQDDATHLNLVKTVNDFVTTVHLTNEKKEKLLQALEKNSSKRLFSFIEWIKNLLQNILHR